MPESLTQEEVLETLGYEPGSAAERVAFVTGFRICEKRHVAATKEGEAHAESLLPCPRCETLIYTHRCDGNNGRGCGGSRHPCSICGKNQNGLRERRATAPKVEKK